MKTQVVYVLTSDGSQHFIEMTLLSVRTLKKYNADATVKLVVDKKTGAYLETTCSDLGKEADIIVGDTPSGFTPMQKSRYLKTSLRQLLKGDFLFVDSDTLVCSSLAEIDHIEADVAAVIDGHVDYHLSEDVYRQKCCPVGFMDLKGEPYFNSGVLLVKDTPIAHQLYELWHRLWKYSLAKGSPYDQPALCQANFEMGHVIKELSGGWNCMTATPWGLYRFLSHAHIIHYFTNNKFFVRKHFFDSLKSHKNSIIPNLVVKSPRRVGVWILSMGDIDVLKMVFQRRPFIFNGISIGYQVQFAIMFLWSKILYATKRVI